MRSDFRDTTDTINKMIQFGTVKYGIVKQLKDRARSERDINSDHEENGSSMSCSPVVEYKSVSPEIHQSNIEHPHSNVLPSRAEESHEDEQKEEKEENRENYNNYSSSSDNNENHVNNFVKNSKKSKIETPPPLETYRNNPIESDPKSNSLAEERASECSPVQNSSSVRLSNSPRTKEKRHRRRMSEEDEENEMSDSHNHKNADQENHAEKNDSHVRIPENLTSGEHQNDPPHQTSPESSSMLPQFPPAPVTLEAIQNIQMAIAQFAAKTIANGTTENEAAMKQLAFLQQTLFNLQQQQLFQIQLIQQLQSQLAMNQLKRDDEEMNEEGEECDEDQGVDNSIENLSASNRKHENQSRNMKGVDDDDLHMDIEHHTSDGEDDVSKEEHQPERSFHQQEQFDQERLSAEKLQVKQESRDGKGSTEENRHIQAELPISLPKQDENTPLPFGSDLASSIITNHDDPPSLDEPNSLEMLQKRAQEVLDSASQGILAGNLADDFAFGKDKTGDGKNRNEPFFKHRCRYCGKVFGSDSALQIHIRSHTGERPFKCNVCGSRFTTKGNLKVHFQRHAQKFPHVPMNSTPIPEHLDKFHPPLLEQMSPEDSPQHQPQMPHPNVPVSLPLPFPPAAGFPGLPIYRPPIEILKSLGPYPNPFFTTLPPLPPKRDQEMPTDLRKQQQSQQSHPHPHPHPPPPRSVSPKINTEEKVEEEPVSLRIKEERIDLESIERPPSRAKSASPPLIPARLTPISQPPPVTSISQHIPDFSPTSTQSSIHPLMREEIPERLPLNYSRSSPERRSPIPSPASIPRSPFLGPMKHEMALLPRPHSNDNSWENFIEVSNTSETLKLKELMKNKKLTDPNQCVVCDRVLSCKSALQMHYRTHTGERPFKCRICGRAFTTKGNLKTHMAVHKIRPPMRNFHQCPVCHKKYSNALVLQQHIRLHTGEPTDLTPEQIQAAEIRDFPPSMMPGSLFHPFAFNFGGGMTRPNGTMGSESSHGENDDNMDCSDDFDDDISSDHLSNGGDSDRPKSNGDDIKGMLFDQKLKIESNRPKSEASSSAPTSPISTMNKSSPTPSDTSQGALDLTPRAPLPPLPPTSIAGSGGLPTMTSHQPPFLPNRPPFGMFPNLPLFPPVSTTTHNMCSAMNSIAQSVMPSAPFNPLALSGVRGSTTCGICFKTFPCHSALEIHYRSHTKERPFKCSICDRGFTTKGNLKQHMLTHKIRDMEQDAFRNRAVKYMNNWKDEYD